MNGKNTKSVPHEQAIVITPQDFKNLKNLAYVLEENVEMASKQSEFANEVIERINKRQNK